MVFCGRPSKACQRCRDRRLKCDLHTGFCGQCVRANIACTGYRDTQQLRIRNESQAIRKKALSGRPPIGPRSLTLSIELRARDSFFAHHVTGSSKSWDFLGQFYDPTHSPEHLTLSIDAVSLAYLSHRVYSDTVRAAARSKYVLALHMTSKALQSSEAAAEDTTLLASLLLDLYEKITNKEPQYDTSWIGHVNGALALVKLRGYEHFRDPSILRVLLRLSTNLLISCIVTENPVPDELNALRAHTGKQVSVGDPKWRLSDLMVHYANLRSDIRRGHLSMASCMSTSMELDGRLQALALDMPTSWLYKTATVDHRSDRFYNSRLDTYPNRHITQSWNVLRLVRILLNESVIDQCLESGGNLTVGARSLLGMANENIETLTGEICASVPQYVACPCITSDRLSKPEDVGWSETINCSLDVSGDLHSSSQNQDCYTLLFPLYVAGRSRGRPSALKPWVMKQLNHISDHFGIRNAKLVARILEQGTDINPWAVYAMLGSYAFVA